jgi:cell division protein ZapA (FtsZ GTPase activity inhibitor)
MMKVILLIAVLLIAAPVWADEKSELQANIRALSWEFQFIQERAKSIQQEIQPLQTRLQAIEKAEQEKKEKK